ncbi:UNVERIFIED_CONTAM: hypothetical protein K2H54_014156 [Gekko kuhli]
MQGEQETFCGLKTTIQIASSHQCPTDKPTTNSLFPNHSDKDLGPPDLLNTIPLPQPLPPTSSWHCYNLIFSGPDPLTLPHTIEFPLPEQPALSLHRPTSVAF